MRIVGVEFDADLSKCVAICEDGSRLKNVTALSASVKVGGLLEVTLTVDVLQARDRNAKDSQKHPDEGVGAID